ncbi:hypothetical protein N0V88_006463 [Collariella sp. IMI 366227]|nr:hypothetical protein N0V88_006463 [Collariella sp. IMI 366227]
MSNAIFRGPLEPTVVRRDSPKARPQLNGTFASPSRPQTPSTPSPKAGSNDNSSKTGSSTTTPSKSPCTPAETTACHTYRSTPSIATAERAAAAKIFLETHFNSLLAAGPSPRQMRQQMLETELFNRARSAAFRASERDILVASEGLRWIVSLVASFQDISNLYLVMEYMPGGDFLSLLIREDTLHESVARFYIAEIILCVEAVHSLKCIHRDIKPDNFLVSATGHLKISDFGLAFDGHWSHDTVDGDEEDKEENRGSDASKKRRSSGINAGIEKHEKKNLHDGESLLSWRNRCGNRVSARSVVGTSQYMAPEVIEGRRYDARCD